MNINLIAVHYNGKKEIVGFRLLDSDSGQVMDQPYDKVLNVVRNNVVIKGIELDGKSGKLKGSNGAFDRYPILFDNKLVSNGIVILNTFDDKGYRVCNFLGKTLETTEKELVKYASNVGISNGKVVTKDNKVFISAISGNYDNIPLNKSTKLHKRLKKIEDDLEYAKQLKKDTILRQHNAGLISVEDPRLPKVITGTPIENSKLHELDPATQMTVEQKIAYIILNLRRVRPFYYSVLNILKRYEANEADDVDTMSVTLDSLYFSSEFILETNLPDLMFSFIHEVCHIAMKHRVRQNGREHDLWNIACDYYINKALAQEFDLHEPGDVVVMKANTKSAVSDKIKIGLPDFVLFNPNINVNTDTPESIYEELYNLNKENNEQSNEQNNEQSNEQNGNQNQDQSGEQNSGGGSSQNNQDNNETNEENKSESSSQNSQSTKGSNEQSNSDDSKLNKFATGEDVDDNDDINENEDTQGTGNETETKGMTDKDSTGEDKSAQGVTEEQRKEGRLVGKEFRGVEIKDVKPDMVDDNKARSMSKDQMNQVSTSLLNRAVTMHRQSNSFGGDNADFLERYVEKVLAPKINWRTLLKNKLTLASQKINTFSAPDKRFRTRGMILPGPKAIENDSLENVKICVDTSGSISPRDIGIALSQVEQLLKVFKAKAELVYWDTRVRAIYPFKDVKELLDKKPMGGGGTDVNCVFDHFETSKDYKIGKKKKPSIIIIFTDGYFDVVDKKYSKYRDTIWVVHDNINFKAPFGSQAPLKNDD